MKIYRCQHCNFKVMKNDKKGIHSAKHIMGKHYEDKHKELLPEHMTGYRWFYYLLTKKEKGSCVMCHNETEFNETTMKYSRFCDNPLCIYKYKVMRNRRMIAKYGKVHRLDEPEVQKAMQQNRRIAGKYKWSDGKTEFPYLSSYECDFLRFLDKELNWPKSDIIAPSPNTYTYKYKDKDHFYMPDFFIPSKNLEVEIKDDGSAKNINIESREKDKIKDELLRSCSNIVNYIKIVNKNYSEFMELIKEED